MQKETRMFFYNIIIPRVQPSGVIKANTVVEDQCRCLYNIIILLKDRDMWDIGSSLRSFLSKI